MFFSASQIALSVGIRNMGFFANDFRNKNVQYMSFMAKFK
jgi:hypothetical protein